MSAPDRKPISQLPVATYIQQQDLMVIVQDGVTKQVAMAHMPQPGEAQQQVFIGQPEVEPNYPAFAFIAQTIEGQTVYEMAVMTP